MEEFYDAIDLLKGMIARPSISRDESDVADFLQSRWKAAGHVVHRRGNNLWIISEEFDTPVLLRLTTRIAHSQSITDIGERENAEIKQYEKKPAKYIMMPAYAKAKHPVVEERTKKLIAFSEICDFNRIEMGGTDLGIITAGDCYQYVKEALGDSVSVLKLGMLNPLPEKLIRDFASKVKRLVVVEELDGIIETHVRSLGLPVEGKSLFTPIGEYNQDTVRKVFGSALNEKADCEVNVPVRPPMMCAGCPHRGMFYALSKNKITVMGDIGCYTLGAQAPLTALDSTLCMGASVSGLHGFNLADKGQRRTACVIGDSTFIHSGITGLINVAYNSTSSTVIVLDNSITGMTGHQQNPTTGYNIKGDPASKVDLEALCKAVGIKRVRVVDPYNIAECEKAVLEETASDEASVIISRRPCVLLKSVKAKSPVKVDADKCKGCKKCMTLGCPAISIKNKKAVIDHTLCVGCDVCKQLCAFGAIESEDR